MSNYGFFTKKKFLENFRIALTGMSVDTLYTAKSKKFRSPIVINTILIKITNITMLLTNIKILFQKCIRPNTCPKSKIRIL